MSDTPHEQLDYRTIFGPDTWDAAMSSLPSSREQAMVIDFLDKLVDATSIHILTSDNPTDTTD